MKKSTPTLEKKLNEQKVPVGPNGYKLGGYYAVYEGDLFVHPQNEIWYMFDKKDGRWYDTNEFGASVDEDEGITLDLYLQVLPNIDDLIAEDTPKMRAARKATNRIFKTRNPRNIAKINKDLRGYDPGEM
jgi:hypothetical protein